MEVTIYEDEHGQSRVTVRGEAAGKAEEVAKIFKAIKKELNKKEEE